MAKSAATSDTKKSSNEALTKWETKLAEMAGQATKTVASIGSGGNFISLKGGILSYQQKAVKDNKMNVVILDHILVNAHYAGDYDPNGGPASPDCFALGRIAAELVPHQNVEKPYNNVCKGCKMKEFGSARKGQGKACGDHVKLAMINANEVDDALHAELASLMLPYFSTIEWSSYVRQLAEMYKKPPLAFVTELALVNDKRAQFKTVFKMIEPVELDAFEGLITRHGLVQSDIMAPFPKFAEEEAAPSKPAKKRKY